MNKYMPGYTSAEVVAWKSDLSASVGRVSLVAWSIIYPVSHVGINMQSVLRDTCMTVALGDNRWDGKCASKSVFFSVILKCRNDGD